MSIASGGPEHGRRISAPLGHSRLMEYPYECEWPRHGTCRAQYDTWTGAFTGIAHSRVVAGGVAESWHERPEAWEAMRQRDEGAVDA